MTTHVLTALCRVSALQRYTLQWLYVSYHTDITVCVTGIKFQTAPFLLQRMGFSLVRLLICLPTVRTMLDVLKQCIYARGDLVVPRSRTTRYGQRSFAVASPTLWNSLSLSVRDPSLTLSQFCARLKTALFCRAYETLA